MEINGDKTAASSCQLKMLVLKFALDFPPFFLFHDFDLEWDFKNIFIPLLRNKDLASSLDVSASPAECM